MSICASFNIAFDLTVLIFDMMMKWKVRIDARSALHMYYNLSLDSCSMENLYDIIQYRTNPIKPIKS